MRTTLRCTTLLTMIQRLYCIVTLIAFTSPSSSRLGAPWRSKLERTKVVIVVVVMVTVRAPLFLWVRRQAPEKSPSQLCSQEESKKGRGVFLISDFLQSLQINRRQEFPRRNNCLVSFVTICTKLKTTRPTNLLYCMCIRCRGNVLAYPLPSNDKGHNNRRIEWWEGSTPLNIYTTR
jgi:hypothetical protein